MFWEGNKNVIKNQALLSRDKKCNGKGVQQGSKTQTRQALFESKKQHPPLPPKNPKTLLVEGATGIGIPQYSFVIPLFSSVRVRMMTHALLQTKKRAKLRMDRSFKNHSRWCAFTLSCAFTQDWQKQPNGRT